MKFDWSFNNLALIEEEKASEYIVYQYWIEDGVKLTVTENPGADPKWILKRSDNGQILRGKKVSYPERNERHRKNYD